MYYVVVKSKNTPTEHTILTSFKNKENFDQWNNKEKKKRYRIVKEDVAKRQATELCIPPNANRATRIAVTKEIARMFSRT